MFDFLDDIEQQLDRDSELEGFQTENFGMCVPETPMIDNSLDISEAQAAVPTDPMASELSFGVDVSDFSMEDANETLGDAALGDLNSLQTKLDAENIHSGFVTDGSDQTSNAYSPSFGNSHIDKLYDGHIQNAKDNFDQHLDDFNKAQSSDDMERATNAMQKDVQSQKFWEESKAQAECSAAKDQAFLDYINGVNEILDRNK